MTFSMPPSSYRTLQPEHRRRGVRVWDVVLTVILLVLIGMETLVASYAGLWLAMASDACGANGCNMEVMSFGMWFAVIAPWVLLLIAVIVSVILLVRHKVAFWVPLVTVGLLVLPWFGGAAIIGASLSV